jgi:hypothetical protein
VDILNKKYWRQLPNRDEVLDQVYEFLKLISQQKFSEAEKFVLTAPINKVVEVLRTNLENFAVQDLDDETLEIFGNDLVLAISDPSDMDEFYLFPEFSGNSYVVQVNEKLKIKIPVAGFATPIRACFILVENDQLYFLRLEKFSSI